MPYIIDKTTGQEQFVDKSQLGRQMQPPTMEGVSGAGATGVGGAGFDMASIYESVKPLLLMQALQDPKNASKYATVLGMGEKIYNKEESVAATKKKEEMKRAELLYDELDKLYEAWKKIPTAARVLPGAGRYSKELAAYNAAKNLVNYMLITTMADKRITNEERDIFLKGNFPRLLQSDESAKAIIDATKDFVKMHTQFDPPAESPTEPEMTIDDYMQQYLE